MVKKTILIMALLFTFCSSAFAFDGESIVCVTPNGDLSIEQFVEGTNECHDVPAGVINLIKNDQAIEINTFTTKPNQYYELSFEGVSGEFYHLYATSDDRAQIHETIYPSLIPKGGITVMLSVEDPNDGNLKSFPYPAMLVKK